MSICFRATPKGLAVALFVFCGLPGESGFGQQSTSADGQVTEPANKSVSKITGHIILGGPETYEVVVDSAAPGYLDFAADELVDYLCRVVGNPGAIQKTHQLSPGHKGIFIEESKSLAPGGYVILFDKNQHLHITGNNAYHLTIRDVLSGGALPSGRRYYLGTLNAVYGLLRQLGCEWYFPGDLGTVIPVAPTITVTEETGEPFFKYIKPHHGQREAGDAFDGIWALRHGACNVTGVTHGHNWGSIMGLTQAPPPMSEPDRRDFWWSDCAQVDPSPDGEPLRCGHPEYMAMLPEDGVSPRPATHMDYYGLGWQYKPEAQGDDRFPNGIYDPFANRFTLAPHEVFDHYSGQVCTSNPGVLIAFVDYIHWWFNHRSDADCLALSPNDGAGYCDCINCQALDGSRDRTTLYGDINGDGLVDIADQRLWDELPPEKQAYIDIGQFTWTPAEATDDSIVSFSEDMFLAGDKHVTDRLLTFYAQVAERVQSSHPDKTIGAYLYKTGRLLPRRSGHRLPDNLCLSLAHNSAHRLSDLQIAQDSAIEQYWAQLHPGRVGCYDIAGWMSMGTPQPLGQGLVNRIKSWQQNNLLGALLYLGSSESQLGLDSFLFARLMWDPNQDVNALKDRYFADLYGNSAEQIKQYTDIVAERRQAFTRNLYTEANPAELRGISPNVARVAYTFADERLDGLIQEALQKTNDSITGERLQRVANNWEYSKAVSQAIYAIKSLTEVPFDSATGEWAMYKDAVIRRSSYFATFNGSAIDQVIYDTSKLLAVPWFSSDYALLSLPESYLGPFEAYPAGGATWTEGYDQENARAYWRLKFNNASHDIVQRDGEDCLRCVSGNSASFASLILGPNILQAEYPGDKWIQYLVTFKIENPALDRLEHNGNVRLLYNTYGSSTPSTSRTDRRLSVEDCRDWMTTGFFVKADCDVNRIDFKLYTGCRGHLIIKDAKLIIYQAQPDPVPHIVSARSRVGHGGSAWFDLDLPLEGEPMVECRVTDTLAIEFTFSEPIAGVSNKDVSLTCSNESCGTVMHTTYPNGNHNKLLVLIGSPPDGDCMTITLNSVARQNCASLIAGNNNVRLKILRGDINADGVVNSDDAALVRAAMGNVLTADNFRLDVDADNDIDADDHAVVDYANGHTTPCSAPVEDDIDGDGVRDSADNCPQQPNAGQEDSDSDGTGNICDPCPLDKPDDTDGDGICDHDDICYGNDATGDCDQDGICDDSDPCPKPVLTGAASRKTHGQAGEWDINLTAGDTESRFAQLGTSVPNELLIVATFDRDVALLTGSDAVTTDVGTVIDVVFGETENALKITIIDLPVAAQMNLAFPGVVATSAPHPALTCDSTLCIRAIVGDYDNNGSADLLDLARIKNAGYLNNPVGTIDLARADFDCSGYPNLFDLACVKQTGLLNQTAPACPMPAIRP